MLITFRMSLDLNLESFSVIIGPDVTDVFLF